MLKKNTTLFFIFCFLAASSLYVEFNLFHPSNKKLIESLQQKITFFEQQEIGVEQQLEAQFQKDSTAEMDINAAFDGAIYRNDSLINWSNANHILLKNSKVIKEGNTIQFFKYLIAILRLNLNFLK